jgi:hypothetical protein
MIVCLTGCNRGIQSKDAVRQAIIDHLSKRNLNVSSMDVQVTEVQFNGKEADATVSFTPKGSKGQGMSIQYHLEQQGNHWAVVGRRDAGAPHGGTPAPPQGANPHGGAEGAAPGMPPAGGAGAAGGAMPSPQDLPPASKKK